MIKDGEIDKLTDEMQDLINRCKDAGLICLVVGCHVDVLDQLCCDVHRLQAIQAMTSQASFDLLRAYDKKKNPNDRNH